MSVRALCNCNLNVRTQHAHMIICSSCLYTILYTTGTLQLSVNTVQHPYIKNLLACRNIRSAADIVVFYKSYPPEERESHTPARLPRAAGPVPLSAGSKIQPASAPPADGQQPHTPYRHAVTARHRPVSGVPAVTLSHTQATVTYQRLRERPRALAPFVAPFCAPLTIFLYWPSYFAFFLQEKTGV